MGRASNVREQIVAPQTLPFEILDLGKFLLKYARYKFIVSSLRITRKFDLKYEKFADGPLRGMYCPNYRVSSAIRLSYRQALCVLKFRRDESLAELLKLFGRQLFI
jgi:hypothetical protein